MPLITSVRRPVYIDRNAGGRKVYRVALAEGTRVQPDNTALLLLSKPLVFVTQRADRSVKGARVGPGLREAQAAAEREQHDVRDRAGHGCGNHLHLSWDHAAAKPFEIADWVTVFDIPVQPVEPTPPPPPEPVPPAPVPPTSRENVLDP